MSRHRNFVTPLGWNGPHQELNPLLATLPPGTQTRLRSMADAFGRIDQQMLEEIREDKRRSDSRFLRPESAEMELCLAKWVERRRNGLFSDSDVMSYLSDTSCLTAWTSVQKALLEFQGRKDHNHLISWDLARLGATHVLDPGLQAVELYTSVREHLPPDSTIVLGIWLKLMTLLVFDDIYSRRAYTDEQVDRSPPSHPFSLAMAQLRESTIQHREPVTQAQSNNSTLLTVSWTTTISCAVLLVPAWRLSTQGTGSTANSDFWLLLQQTCMQLLNLFTTFAPVYRKKSDRELPWPRIWTFVLVVLGVCCSAAALAAYFFASVMWSSSLSFLASAAQACLVLQLALFMDAAWSVRPKNH